MHRACGRCCEATEAARQKGLSVVSGLAWRYDTGVQETMKRVHDGAIGEITAIQEVCNTGSLRSLPRQTGMTEMEYQTLQLVRLQLALGRSAGTESGAQRGQGSVGIARRATGHGLGHGGP